MTESIDSSDQKSEREALLTTEFTHEDEDFDDVEDMLYQAVDALHKAQYGHKEENHVFEAKEHIEIAWWMMHDISEQSNPE